MKETYDKPRQHIKKQRHYFADKVPSSQSCGFSSSHVWIWELAYKESWVLKNWCFWTVVLEKPLRVPWTARRSNQSILKEISPEYALEGLMLKLKLQNYGRLMLRTDSLEKTWCWESSKVGGIGDIGEWDDWKVSPTWWTWVWVSSGSWWWTQRPGLLQSTGSPRVGHKWSTELTENSGKKRIHMGSMKKHNRPNLWNERSQLGFCFHLYFFPMNSQFCLGMYLSPTCSGVKWEGNWLYPKHQWVDPGCPAIQSYSFHSLWQGLV